MRIDHQPIFRKIIIPWYDSPLVCWIMLVAMAGVILFSLSGVVVALGQAEYTPFLLVPLVLLAAGLFLLISVSLRLIQTYSRPKE